jgi:hypothetical protein
LTELVVGILAIVKIKMATVLARARRRVRGHIAICIAVVRGSIAACLLLQRWTVSTFRMMSRTSSEKGSKMAKSKKVFSEIQNLCVELAEGKTPAFFDSTILELDRAIQLYKEIKNLSDDKKSVEKLHDLKMQYLSMDLADPDLKKIEIQIQDLQENLQTRGLIDYDQDCC